MNTTMNADPAPTENQPLAAKSAADTVTWPDAPKRQASRARPPQLSDHLLRDLGINRFGFREIA